MPVILCVIIAAALALIVGVVTRYLTITNLKNNAESKIGNAEAKAREIIDILQAIKGWSPYSKSVGKMRFGKLYGVQRAFIREASTLQNKAKTISKNRK